MGLSIVNWAVSGAGIPASVGKEFHHFKAERLYIISDNSLETSDANWRHHPTKLYTTTFSFYFQGYNAPRHCIFARKTIVWFQKREKLCGRALSFGDKGFWFNSRITHQDRITFIWSLSGKLFHFMRDLMWVQIGFGSFALTSCSLIITINNGLGVISEYIEYITQKITPLSIL